MRQIYITISRAFLSSQNKVGILWVIITFNANLGVSKGDGV